MGIAGLAAFLLTKRPEYLINPSWLVLPQFQNGSMIQDKGISLDVSAVQLGKTNQGVRASLLENNKMRLGRVKGVLGFNKLHCF